MKKKQPKMPFILAVIRAIFPLIELFPPLARKFAARLFFQPIRFPAKPVEKEFLNKATIKDIEYNGNRIKTYYWGEGIPIIFVHGWSGRATQFYNFFQKFNEEGFQIISFDAPGHGLSEGNRTSLIEFADIIEILKKETKAELIVGHSLGGAAAILAAGKFLGLKQIVTIGSPTIAQEILNDFMRRVNATMISGEGILDYIKEITGKKLDNFVALNLLSDVKDASLNIIHDKHDAEVAIQHAYALVEKYPDVTLLETEGLGHLRILKNSEVIQYVIDIMLKTKNLTKEIVD